MQIITQYFPNLTETQIEQFSKLQELYTFWNEQINVISRKDTENFYERHVLHSLGIAKVMPFVDGSQILDIGTGGGFPGIPLAILFPNCQFTLVDSIGKKIKSTNRPYVSSQRFCRVRQPLQRWYDRFARCALWLSYEDRVRYLVAAGC